MYVTSIPLPVVVAVALASAGGISQFEEGRVDSLWTLGRETTIYAALAKGAARIAIPCLRLVVPNAATYSDVFLLQPTAD